MERLPRIGPVYMTAPTTGFLGKNETQGGGDSLMNIGTEQTNKPVSLNAYVFMCVLWVLYVCVFMCVRVCVCVRVCLCECLCSTCA
jgi:hypothetical protein